MTRMTACDTVTTLERRRVTAAPLCATPSTFHANSMARTSRLHARRLEHGLLHIFIPFLVLLGISGSHAQPAVVQYQDCFSGSNTQQKINVSTVYAQLVPEEDSRAHLNFTVIGSTPQEIFEASNDAVASTSAVAYSAHIALTTNASNSIHNDIHADIRCLEQQFVLLRDITSTIALACHQYHWDVLPTASWGLCVV